MKLIALETENPGVTAEQFAPYLKDEARAVWELEQQGLVREAYFRADQHTTVLVLECDSTSHAEQVLASLPLVKHGLISFEIIPLVPYSGFARLFA
ncbi:MAG: superoxide dismutase [Chloroflexi bacterium]|nr:superoxide dismutase [Chloroflexota bacterium]